MPEPSSKPAPALSLSARLIIAFTAAAFVTLALAMAYIDRAVKHGLVSVHEDMLGDLLAALRHAIDDNEGDLHAAEMMILHAIGADKNDKSFACLTNAAGQTLMKTNGFDDFSPPLASFPPPASPGPTQIKLAETRHAGRPLFLATALMRRPGSEGILTFYYLADAQPEEDFITKFRIELGLVLVAGTLLSAALAGIISRRGLRPVGQITTEIERTSAQALQQPDADHDSTPQAIRLPREIARLSNAFTALRSRLSRSFHQLRQFSDDAAHEIRTPLNNMMGLTSLTLQRDRSPEEYRAALVSTLEECDRLKKLADGLLFISRADHHRSVLTPTTFAAHEAIAEVVDYHLEVAREQDITLTVSAKGQLTADRMLFRQALTNLISNSLRHTPPGGRIGIVFDSISDPAGTALLTVTDTGEGIAPGHLPRIFDRFYRIDAARTHQAEAQTGLGLAIVKAILELHGGTVTAASKPGEGTTFSLTWGYEKQGMQE